MQSLQLRFVRIEVAVVAFAAIAMGCNPRAPQAADQASSSVIGDKLVAGVLNAPPASGINPQTNAPEGYLVEALRLVGRNSGIAVEFVVADWATAGAALQSRRIDVVVGPVFRTEGRAREFAFTDELLLYAVVGVVRSNQSAVRTIEDLRRPGVRIAVGKGGFDSEFVTRHMPQAKITAFPPDDPTLSMAEVMAGRSDAAIVDFATASRFVRENPTLSLLARAEPLALQSTGLMLRSTDLRLRDFLNIALRNLDLSGELRLLDQRFGASSSWYARAHASAFAAP